MKGLNICLLVSAMVAGLPAQLDTIPAKTNLTVRTVENIDATSPSDNRIYKAVVDHDVANSEGFVVIPCGTTAELILRDSTDNTIVVDLESLDVNGRRYTVATNTEAIAAKGPGKPNVGTNKRTAKYVGGGALIGTVIGAIAGGPTGAAIGAAVGAGAGALGQTTTRGEKVMLPPETQVTFRLDQPLVVGGADDGFTKDGRHYHR